MHKCSSTSPSLPPDSSDRPAHKNGQASMTAVATSGLAKTRVCPSRSNADQAAGHAVHIASHSRGRRSGHGSCPTLSATKSENAVSDHSTASRQPSPPRDCTQQELRPAGQADDQPQTGKDELPLERECLHLLPQALLDSWAKPSNGGRVPHK
jgi:hypothetical protein